MMLSVLLFDNDLDAPSFEKNLTSRIANIRLAWELHGGLRSVELDWGGPSVAAYDFYQKYLGYRLVIVDQFCDRPVADAFITGISIVPTGVRLLAHGFWFRHYDELYNFDDTAQDTQQGSLSYTTEGATYTFTDDGQDFGDWSSTSSPGLYKVIVTNSDGTESWAFLGDTVSATEIKVYVDYTLTTSGWNGQSITGKTPSSYEVQKTYNYKTTTDVIKELLAQEVTCISTDQSDIDETGTVIGYWEPPIEEGGMFPGEIIEKLASLSDSNYNQWNYWVQNTSFDGVTPQKPRPYFKAQVNDGTFDWQVYRWMLAADSISADRNIQELRNAVRIVYRDMESDDAMALYPTTGYVTDADSISEYWRREFVTSGGDSVSAIAAQYANLYLAKYKDPLLSRTIKLSSPYILDSNNAKWPLWFPIKYSKSYFRLADLLADVSLFDTTWNRKACGQAMIMEYDSARNTLSISLDTTPDALDYLLARITAFQ